MIKIKLKRVGLKIVLLLSLLFSLILQTNALAAIYPANAGIKPNSGQILNSKAGSLLNVGSKTQYIWLKPGQRIIGPKADGTVKDSSAEEVRPTVPIGGHEQEVGYDSVANSFTNQAGYFWHQVNVEAASTQRFFVRAWDNADPANATYFGESIVFNSTTNPDAGPSNVSLNSFATIFPKQMPENPVFQDPTIVRGNSTSAPQVTVKAVIKLGTRYANFRLYEGATVKYPSGNLYYDASYGYAAPNDSSVLSWNIPLKHKGDDGKTYTCKVIATNSFGDSAEISQTIPVPYNEDNSFPVPIIDLRLKSWDSSNRKLTLTWTAPYDIDRYGEGPEAGSKVKGYVFKANASEIIDRPTAIFSSEQINPDLVPNWETSTLLVTPESVATPKVFPEQEEAVLDIPVELGDYFFVAAKSYDTEGNMSYVSNVVGVFTPAPGIPGSASDLTTSLNEDKSVSLNWQLTNTTTAEVLRSINQGISWESSDVMGTTWGGDADIPNAWYRVKAKGGTFAPEIVGKHTFSFIRPEGGMGISTFHLPFKITSPDVSTAQKFVEALNAAAGANVVQVFTSWDNQTKKFKGGRIKYEEGKLSEESITKLKEIEMGQGIDYQISVSKPVSLVVVGKF